MKCCLGHSKMPEPKSVVRVVQYNNLPELTYKTAGISLQKIKNDHVYFFICRLLGASNSLNIKKRPTVACPTAANYLFLSDIWCQFIWKRRFCSLRLAGRQWCFILKCIMRYSSFANKLSSQLWIRNIGNIAIVRSFLKPQRRQT